MKTATAALCPEPIVHVAHVAPAAPIALGRNRLADYLELTKPRVTVLVLFTVAAGAVLAGAGRVPAGVLLHVLLGTALVAAGASALNQWLERHRDALMRRTENRPLPSGRLQPREVLLFGSALGVVGVAYLALTLSQPWAALVAAFTFATYVGVYTPLKTRTTANTLIGAVPGALPPLIGYTAVRGALTLEAAALFLILFTWQVPHFLAIAWTYRDEYARAGHRMLPVVDRAGRRTARQMVAWCVALLAAGAAPAWCGAAGPFTPVYLAGALLLGLVFLASALRFRRDKSVRQARRVLRASLVYLPGLLALLLLTKYLNS
jgi:protoheme IX farnesyltransferase